MKDITDAFMKRQEEELEVFTIVEGALKLIIDGRELIMPRKVLDALEKNQRYYQLSNIRDVEENYGILERNKFIPYTFLRWVYENRQLLLSQGRRPEEDRPSHLTFAGELEKSIANASQEGLVSEAKRQARGIKKSFDHIYELICPENASSHFKIPLSLGFMDNVYIDDVRFVRKKFPEDIEFVVLDSDRRSMNGVLVFTRGAEDLESKKRQLTLALSGNGTPVDISFYALPERTKIIRDGVYIRRGKKLHVEDIRERHGFEEPIEPPYTRFSHPIFQLL